MIIPVVAGLICGSLGLLAFLAGYYRGLSRRQPPDQVTITARVLKIDTDIVTEAQISEIVARCQPVIVRYPGHKLIRAQLDSTNAIR